MATATNRVPNRSSGTYFLETDLTVVQQSAGTFAGASIGLTEKGPAFEIMPSSDFSDRRQRLGNLNPDFPSSYYANAFLAQASNYKEIRVLGLEGYSERTTEGGYDKAFPIVYNTPSGTETPRDPGIAPLVASMESVGALLKPRRTAFTTLPEVDFVTVLASPAPTDEEFTLEITFVDTTTQTVICSLREDSKSYIVTLFGDDPRDGTKLQGGVPPLWVEWSVPSTTRKISATGSNLYYYPGTTVSASALDLMSGDITIETGFTYSTVHTVTTVVKALGIITVTTAAPHLLVSGQTILLTAVTGFGGADINVNWVITNAAGSAFELVVTPAEYAAITGGPGAGGTATQQFIATWEPEVMNLGGGTGNEIEYQTPTTPWFVSDADIDGNVKRLFRFWSISDGEFANQEIKLEVSNINPDGNLGFGSFDIVLREFSDKEDIQRKVVGTFINLTMNPKSDNYILRRIGDGEQFKLGSKYIFIEMNENDTLPTDALPYGVEGYQNTTGLKLEDVVWTTEYDLTKPLSKQALGLANNRTNMFATLKPGQLVFKNAPNNSNALGKGFHLNPENNANLSTALFDTVNQTIYDISTTNTTNVTGLDKAKRCKFVVAFAGGFDGFNVYSERTWSDPTSKDYEALDTAIQIFSDFESLDADFSVMVTPDLNFQDHATAAERVLEMVAGRGDAIYLFDFRYELDPIAEDAQTEMNSSQMKSSYSAVYYPYVQMEDSINKTNIWLPPSIVALATIAATATNEAVWQPPAGSLRTIADNLVRTRKRMKLDDRETLKAANINPITTFPGSGFEITETRTTQEVFSALSFIHNRLLLGYAKKALTQVLRPLLHQLNTTSFAEQYINAVTPIFDRVKKLNGLEEFTVNVVNQTDDRTTVYGQIEIVPLYPVERIITEFTLTNGQINFGG